MVISGQSGIGWDDRNNLWSFPDSFVALSSYAKKWASRVNPFARVEYIPNGVDLIKFSPKGENLKLRLKRPVVLAVGAFTPTKRIDLVIKAVSKLKETSLLVVGGDGELKSELERIGNNLLGERFQLITLPFEKMHQVYRSVDLFTLGSESYYSFEIVFVEAMATNLPVVANDDPIRREIIGNAGIFVNPKETETYSEALNKALKIDWGEKPRHQAEKFSWEKIAGKYNDLFESLTKR
jgi:glycosyltransferase involved in cell wall biosynthesis